MFIDNLSKKEKIGLLVSCIFMLFTIVDWLVIRPINKKIAQLNSEIKISRSQLTFDLANDSQKDEMAKEYEKYAKYQQTYPSDEEEITVLLSALEDLGRDSGITLLDMKPQQTDLTDMYKQYSISIESEGSLDALVKFLYNLNVSEHLIRVEKLRFSARDKNSKLINASILVTKVFVL